MFPVSWSMFSSSSAMMFRSRMRSALPGMTSSTARHTVRHASRGDDLGALGLPRHAALGGHGDRGAGDGCLVRARHGLASDRARCLPDRGFDALSTSATGRRGREFPRHYQGWRWACPQWSPWLAHRWQRNAPATIARVEPGRLYCRGLHERGFVVLHRLVVPGAVLLVLAGFVLVLKVGVAQLRSVVLAVLIAGQRASSRVPARNFSPLNAPGASAWNSAATAPTSSSHLAWCPADLAVCSSPMTCLVRRMARANLA